MVLEAAGKKAGAPDVLFALPSRIAGGWQDATDDVAVEVLDFDAGAEHAVVDFAGDRRLSRPGQPGEPDDRRKEPWAPGRRHQRLTIGGSDTRRARGTARAGRTGSSPGRGCSVQTRVFVSTRPSAVLVLRKCLAAK